MDLTWFFGYFFSGTDVDIDFVGWLVWLFTPLMITFLLPCIIILLFYMSALIVFIYRHRHKLDLSKIVDEIEHQRYWNGAVYAVCIMWEAHGSLWHGYEVRGFENIPDEGPAMIIYYHGALPIDYYYLASKVMLYKKRIIHSVADRFMFQVPGWSLLMEVLKVFPGSVSSCVKVLQDGNLMAIAPGGVREAQFSDEYYTLVWGNRTGFAKVALQARCPIIPVYTQNVREAFRSVQIGKSFFAYIYERFRLPITPIYGGFPVKLTTFVGKPIYFDAETTTPEELAEMAREAVAKLIQTHQKVPGSILRSLVERVVTV